MLKLAMCLYKKCFGYLFLLLIEALFFYLNIVQYTSDTILTVRVIQITDHIQATDMKIIVNTTDIIKATEEITMNRTDSDKLQQTSLSWGQKKHYSIAFIVNNLLKCAQCKASSDIFLHAYQTCKEIVM